MILSSQEYVWYASYGSNLCEERFLCYIEGGKPFGSTKSEKGCRNQSPPLQTRCILLKFSLYFSSYSSRWGGGVAFVGTNMQEDNSTLSRMYLITKEQFIDVVKQENEISDVDINFEKVIERQADVVHKSLYGHILYVGKCDGYPIFTFTHKLDQTQRNITVPSESYLNMLIRGYREAYSFTDEQIVNYLITKPGIKGIFSRNRLFSLVKKDNIG